MSKVTNRVEAPSNTFFGVILLWTEKSAKSRKVFDSEERVSSACPAL